MSKIVHVMFACFYKNGFGYQENILPAKHKQLGYEVEIITYNKGGDASYEKEPAPCTYLNQDGIKVHVLATNGSILRAIPLVNLFINVTKGTYEKLEQLNPDIVFIHGINCQDNMEVVRYVKKKHNVKLYVDNHSDFYNAPLNSIKNKIIRYVSGGIKGYRLGKYAEKVWGVSPWRVVYQEKVYSVPHDKCGLLVMGGDEQKIDWNNKKSIRIDVRSKLRIPEDAFVLISGGKIDKAKNIHKLVDAITDINRNNIHLILFGRYEKDMLDMSDKLNSTPNVHFIGWVSADDAYNYFLASDLAVFPGTHSVLWEQSCACGLPGIYKDWEGGFNHVDLKGNCILLSKDTVLGIKEALLSLIDDKDRYDKMREHASIECRKEFSYIEIAKKSINHQQQY